MELKYCCTNNKIDAVKLLIVPYGIEILNNSLCFMVQNAFNRTLWN